MIQIGNKIKVNNCSSVVPKYHGLTAIVDDAEQIDDTRRDSLGRVYNKGKHTEYLCRFCREDIQKHKLPTTKLWLRLEHITRKKNQDTWEGK